MKYFQETLDLLKPSSLYYTICLGMDGNYSYVSPSYDENFNLIYDTLLGKPFYVTLHPDDIKICEEVAGKCFQNPGQLFPATLRKHNGKGGYVVTQWELRGLLDENGNPEGILCIGHNISEYYATKYALEDATLSIQNRDKQLDDIAFINSHIIRRPLANIIGLANVLDQMDLDKNLATIINMVVESAVALDDEVKKISHKAEHMSS